MAPADSTAALRADLARRVQDNLRDGASHLARIALDCLAEYARGDFDDVAVLRSELSDFAAELAAVRPGKTALHNLVARWRSNIAIFDGDLEALRDYAAEQAQEVRTWADAASDATVRSAVNRLEGHHRLLTHSISSTVQNILQRVPRGGLEAIITEARPGAEGWSLAAALARDGVPVTYITDAQAGVFVPTVDAVIVGAEAILADGSVVNRAGTRLIALGAREAGVPVYVCAESFKCTTVHPDEVVLEEKSGSELRPPPVPGVRARNVYFEVTPAELVTDWLSNEALATRFRQPDPASGA